MEGPNGIHLAAAKGLHHLPDAGPHFFPGLKAEIHHAVQAVPAAAQHFHTAQEHGGVGIVAAGMAGILLLGDADPGPFQVFRVFPQGQGVHIRPQGDVGAGPPGVQRDQNSGFRHHFIGQAQVPDFFQNIVPGLVFFAAQFCQAVDRTPVPDHRFFHTVRVYFFHRLPLKLPVLRFCQNALPARAPPFRSGSQGPRTPAPPPHRLPNSSRRPSPHRWPP